MRASNSGQGVFAASTDNLSISSTASSASIMLRKMGQGMKRSSRSIKGLFRPKSVIGVPAADGPLVQSVATAEVSMVTAEADREEANAFVSIQEPPKIGGGSSTNSSRPATAEKPGSSNENRDTWARKSIVGGERERAEVLAAVRKGILKRMSCSISPIDPLTNNCAGSATDSMPSSPVVTEGSILGSEGVPSTPGTPDGRASSADGKDDYFLASARFVNGSTRSLPAGGAHGGARNISFSTRVQFHDVWSAQDYDRRGDVATCNRLTPMLAQQIKEELNTFKMVSFDSFVPFDKPKLTTQTGNGSP